MQHLEMLMTWRFSHQDWRPVRTRTCSGPAYNAMGFAWRPLWRVTKDPELRGRAQMVKRSIALTMSPFRAFGSMPAPSPALLKRWIFAQPMMTTRLLGYNLNGPQSAPLFRPNWRRAIPTGIVQQCAHTWRSSWLLWHTALGMRMWKCKRNICLARSTRLWNQARRHLV